MSTILKALRRVEEDKRLQAARSLEEAVVEPAAVRGSGSGRLWWVLLLLVAGLGIGALGWSLSSIFGGGGVEQTAPVAAAREPSTSVVVVPQPESAAARREAPSRPAAGAPIPLRAATARDRARVTPRAAAPANEMAARAPREPAPASSPQPQTRSRTASNARPSARAPRAEPKPTPEPRTREMALSRTEPTPSREVVPQPIEELPEEVPVAVKPARLAADFGTAREEEPESAAAAESTPPQTSASETAASEPVVQYEALTPEPAPGEPEPVAVIGGTPLERAVAAEAKQSGVPRVSRIIWHPSPARRVAFLSVKDEPAMRVGEGQSVGGYKVAKIGVSDVELVRNGVTTRRRVGAN